jgi:hypothetical protein
LREAVHALLDDRLDASKGAKADGTGVIVKAINKVSCEDILMNAKILLSTLSQCVCLA